MATNRPDGLKRYFDQELIPIAVDAAAWCEDKVLRTEQAVERAPLASVILAVLAGMALAVCMVPHKRRASQVGTTRSTLRSL